MWFEDVLFFVAGIGALAGALGVVLLQNPFYSVLSLVGHLLGLAVLFLLLHPEFPPAPPVSGGRGGGWLRGGGCWSFPCWWCPTWGEPGSRCTPSAAAWRCSGR